MSPTMKRFLMLMCIAGCISGVASVCMAIECQHPTVTDLDDLYGWVCAVLFLLMVGLPSDCASDNESNNH